MKLEKGRKYDIFNLRVSGWNTDACGYNAWYYFDTDGTYLGSDEDGIEPYFEPVDDEIPIEK